MSPMLRTSLIVAAAAAAAVKAQNCTSVAEQLCDADPNCAAFGLFGDRIQLHGCVITVPNTDWTIFARGSGNVYSQLPGSVNVNETACTQHPLSGMEHTCSPAPVPQLYTRQGSIDVGTYENTLFYWNNRVYNVENIACGYWDHAGIWFPDDFGNHSYARIRDFETGVVIANVSSTVGYGFITAFPDYETGIVWLFGTQADRCHGNGYKNNTKVYAWSSTDLVNWNASVEAVFDLGFQTYNVQVTKVGPLAGGTAADTATWALRRTLPSSPSAVLPPHRYAMYLECFSWVINNNADGDLRYGWTLLNGTHAPAGAPCGGPSMRYNPNDDLYYIFTGGNTVHMYRTADFVNWQESNPSPFIAPDEGDAAVAPYSNFPAAALVKGSPPNAAVGVPEPFPRRPFAQYWVGANWTSWVHNSNDADVCCLHHNVTQAYVIWGASTQGRAPLPPLTGTDAGTNAVATAPMPLGQMLSAYFAGMPRP